MTNGGMSQALAGTTQFMVEIGATSPTQAATRGMINKLCANAGVAVGPGALANVGLPIWQVLQNFAEFSLVIHSLAAPIANFQNLLLAGGTAPSWKYTHPPWHCGLELDAHYWYRHPDDRLLDRSRRYGDAGRRYLYRRCPGPTHWVCPTRSIPVTICRLRGSPPATAR